MDRWFEFGFDGFPRGERRKRFYRQRDDPCDSQEDLSGEEDGSSSSSYESGKRASPLRHRERGRENRRREENRSDRPIYYYTLRPDDERVEDGAVSLSLHHESHAREEEGETVGEEIRERTESDLDSAENFFEFESEEEQKSLVRSPSSGEVGGKEWSIRSYFTSTTHSNPRLRSSFGSSSVSFRLHLHNDEEVLVAVCYGGVTPDDPTKRAASRFSSPSSMSIPRCNASNTFDVLAIRGQCRTTKFFSVSQPTVGYDLIENLHVTVAPLPRCPASTLGRLAPWPDLHPALRETNPQLTTLEVSPPRVGHSAAVLGVLNTPSDALQLLFPGVKGEEREPRISHGNSNDENLETARQHFLLSLVLGGCSGLQCPYTGWPSDNQDSGSEFCFSSSTCSPKMTSPTSSLLLSSFPLCLPVIGMPALCVTVIVEEPFFSSPSVQSHWRKANHVEEYTGSSLLCQQLYFPLLSVPDRLSEGVEGVVYSTLTAWPSDSVTKWLRREKKGKMNTEERNGETSRRDVAKEKKEGWKAQTKQKSSPEESTHGCVLEGERRKSSQAVCTFVQLGGTPNGKDPIPLSPVLTLFHLDLCSWRWWTSKQPTYGRDPPARFGHSATAISGPPACLTGRRTEEEAEIEMLCSGSRDEIFIFGGIGGGRREDMGTDSSLPGSIQYLHDVFVLHTTTSVWREIIGLPFHSPYSEVYSIGSHPSEKDKQRWKPQKENLQRGEKEDVGEERIDRVTSQTQLSKKLKAPDKRTFSGSAKINQCGKTYSICSPIEGGPGGRAFHTAVVLSASTSMLDTSPLPIASYGLSSLIGNHSTEKEKEEVEHVREISESMNNVNKFSCGSTGSELVILGGEGDFEAHCTSWIPHNGDPGSEKRRNITAREAPQSFSQGCVWSLNTQTWKWRKWAFPTIRWPDCHTCEAGLDRNPSPHQVCPSGFPSALWGKDFGSSYSKERTVEGERGSQKKREFPSKSLPKLWLPPSPPRNFSDSEQLILERALKAEASQHNFDTGDPFGYFSRCVRALPQAYVLPPSVWRGRDEAQRTGGIISSSPDEMCSSWRDNAIVVCGGAGTVSTNYLTTALLPCGKSLRAETRFELARLLGHPPCRPGRRD